MRPVFGVLAEPQMNSRFRKRSGLVAKNASNTRNDTAARNPQ